MKLRPHRTHVAAVAWPVVITVPWLISVRMIPTTTAIRIVRRRLRRCAQNAHTSRTAVRRRWTSTRPGELEPVEDPSSEEVACTRTA